MWMEVCADGCFEDQRCGAGVLWQVQANGLASARELIEGGEGIADHGFEVEGSRRLIEGPQGLCAVCVKFIQPM